MVCRVCRSIMLFPNSSIPYCRPTVIVGLFFQQVIAMFVMVVAAAEVVVGLAIIMAVFRARRSASVDDANLLKL